MAVTNEQHQEIAKLMGEIVGKAYLASQQTSYQVVLHYSPYVHWVEAWVMKRDEISFENPEANTRITLESREWNPPEYIFDTLRRVRNNLDYLIKHNALPYDNMTKDGWIEKKEQWRL
jgi:hypothetical protein